MTSSSSASQPVRIEDVRLADDNVVRCRTSGTGGEPLLLLHGFMGGSREWVMPAQGLPPGVHWGAPDLPGHGDSPPLSPGEYAPEKLARFLDRVQRALFGGPAWWLGYSMGGRLALAAAAEGVETRGLLLESASPGLATSEERDARRRLDEARAMELERRGTGVFVDRWLDLELFRGLRSGPSEVLDQARALRAGQDAGSMARWLREAGTGVQASYWEALRELRSPVNLLVGGGDEKFLRVAEAMRKARPGSQLTVVPGVGHVPHLEAPEAWRRWVAAALLG